MGRRSKTRYKEECKKTREVTKEVTTRWWERHMDEMEEAGKKNDTSEFHLSSCLPQWTARIPDVGLKLVSSHNFGVGGIGRRAVTRVATGWVISDGAVARRGWVSSLDLGVGQYGWSQ